MAGRYFDEWTVGDRIVHQPSRTVTETDNLQPLHLDAEYAKASEFGQILVNNCITFSFDLGQKPYSTGTGNVR
jgi:acyl dehydratase